MRSRRNSFTFIELLIAFTVFSVIAASIYSALSTGIKFYAQGNTVIEENQKLRIFFETISSDLRNAVNYHPYLEPDWQAGQIVFSAVINVFEQGEMNRQVVKLKYFLDGDKIIRKCAGLKEGLNEEKAQSDVLLEGVKGLKFEYCYQSLGFGEPYQWLDDWETKAGEKSIPRGVKIKLSLNKGNPPKLESFSKTVFIPLGELGTRISG